MDMGKILQIAVFAGIGSLVKGSAGAAIGAVVGATPVGDAAGRIFTNRVNRLQGLGCAECNLGCAPCSGRSMRGLGYCRR